MVGTYTGTIDSQSMFQSETFGCNNAMNAYVYDVSSAPDDFHLAGGGRTIDTS